MSEQRVTDNEQHLVDASGTPIPKPVTWRDRWTAASARTKVIAGSLIALITATAVVLGNLHKIQDYLREPPPPPSVPSIFVEVSNSSDKPIDVAARGDFFLWLPGPDARHTLGKYEFRNLDRTSLDKGIITIMPDSKTRLLAHIMNQKLFGQILEQADCDVAFIVRKAAGGLRTTGNLPFTKDAIDKYYATVDVAAETPRGNKLTDHSNPSPSNATHATSPNAGATSHEDSTPSNVTVVLPRGVIDTGNSERKQGSTRAKGSYEIRFDGQKILIKMDFNVRKSGVSGTGKGQVGFQILDSNGDSLFNANKGLTVGANALLGTASKDFGETYTLLGEPASMLGRGGLVAFSISADDSLGFPTNAAEWTQLLGRDVKELIADIETGETKEIRGWTLKRIGK